MAKIERLLVPGSTELPDCRCGEEMTHAGSDQIGPDAEIRVYRCSACGHEMRLTVWLDPLPSKIGGHQESSLLVASHSPFSASRSP